MTNIFATFCTYLSPFFEEGIINNKTLSMFSSSIMYLAQAHRSSPSLTLYTLARRIRPRR